MCRNQWFYLLTTKVQKISAIIGVWLAEQDISMSDIIFWEIWNWQSLYMLNGCQVKRTAAMYLQRTWQHYCAKSTQPNIVDQRHRGFLLTMMVFFLKECCVSKEHVCMWKGFEDRRRRAIQVSHSWGRVLAGVRSQLHEWLSEWCHDSWMTESCDRSRFGTVSPFMTEAVPVDRQTKTERSKSCSQDFWQSRTVPMTVLTTKNPTEQLSSTVVMVYLSDLSSENKNGAE